MPKLIKSIKNLTGGRCSGLDAIKLPDNYMYDLDNMIVKQGKLESIRRFNESTSYDKLDMSDTIGSQDKIYLYNSPFTFIYLDTASITISGSDALVTTPNAHGLSTGDTVIHTLFDTSSYNGVHTITVMSATTYKFGVSHTVDDSGEVYTLSDNVSDIPMLVTTVGNSSGYLSMYQIPGYVMEDIAYLYSGTGTTTIYNGDNHLYMSYFDSSNIAHNIRLRMSRVNHTLCGSQDVDTLDISTVSYDGPTHSLVGEIPNSWSRAFCIDNVDSTNSTQTDLYSSDMDDYNIGSSPTETYYLYYYNVTVGTGDMYSVSSQQYDSGNNEWYITTGTRTGSTIVMTDYWLVYPPAGKGIGVYLHPVDTVGGRSGTWDTGDYEVATSFIYIDGTESEPVQVEGTNKVSLSGSNSVISAAIVLTLPFPAGIIGGRIYYRTYGSSDEWKLLIDLDFTKGYRLSTGSDYINSWVVHDTDGDYTFINLHGGITDYQHIAIFDPSAETYRSINGYSADEGSVEVVPKCVIVGGNRTWFGSPTLKDIDGDTTYYNDRIYYTPVSKYGVTTTSYYIDLVPTDGKEVTALLYYEGKLLVFKGTLVYVIDVSTGNPYTWYVQLQYNCGGGGYITDNNITITEYGPVWACSTGCFLYDGNTITNLIQRSVDGSNSITQGDWDTYVSAPDNRIGYSRKLKELVVIGDYDFTLGSDKMFILNMNNMAWSTGDGINSSIKYTNIINYDYHTLTVGKKGTDKPEVMYWGADTLSSNNNILVETKMYDFDAPGKSKRIYSVRLKHYSSTSLPIKVEFRSVNDYGVINSSYTAIDTVTISGDKYTIYEMASPISCQAIQFRITTSGSLPTTYSYSLSEIDIQYRTIYKSVPT